MFARVFTLLACLAATFPGPLATEVVEYARTVAERQEQAQLSGAPESCEPVGEPTGDAGDSFSFVCAPLAAPAPVLHTAYDDTAEADLDRFVHPVEPELPLVQSHQDVFSPTRLMRVCLIERALVFSLDLAASPIQPLAPPSC